IDKWGNVMYLLPSFVMVCGPAMMAGTVPIDAVAVAPLPPPPLIFTVGAVVYPEPAFVRVSWVTVAWAAGGVPSGAVAVGGATPVPMPPPSVTAGCPATCG